MKRRRVKGKPAVMQNGPQELRSHVERQWRVSSTTVSGTYVEAYPRIQCRASCGSCRRILERDTDFWGTQ